MKLMRVLSVLFSVNWIRTLLFNIHYFPIESALKLPVFVYRRTVFNKMEGTVTLNCKPNTGMVRIGVPEIGMQDHHYNRTVWQVLGGVIISGNTVIGRGSRVSVNKGAVLQFGNNFIANGDFEIVCRKRIVFGDDCLLSWGLLIMDTDFHKIFKEGIKEEVTNPDMPIVIGNHVWIGCRVTILKGTTIPSGCVVAANSTITKSYTEENAIYAGQGHGVKVVKEQIKWYM